MGIYCLPCLSGHRKRSAANYRIFFTIRDMWGVLFCPRYPWGVLELLHGTSSTSAART